MGTTIHLVHCAPRGSGNFPLATQASVSWGELLGFPNDEPSPEYQEVIDQLVAMSDNTGEC
ncbi:hypothetical protein GQ600_22564 [Phytophthora cactorum]|nr:hypothetical protein GQ600_22564 [Phytophthora cactorum]